MKKLSAIFLALAIMISLCSCVCNEVADISKDGKVTLNTAVYIEKEDATEETLEMFGEDAVVTDETIKGVDYKKVSSSEEFATTKEFSKYLYGQSPEQTETMSVAFFDYARCNTKGFYGRLSSDVMDVFKEDGAPVYTLTFKFPYEIKKTNLTKEADGKTVVFDSTKHDKLNVYAVTSACTEDWATGDVYQNIKALNSEASKLGDFTVKTKLYNNNRIKVSWTTCKNAGYYEVKYKVKGQKDYALETTFGGNSINLYDLESGKTYQITVSAYKSLISENKKSVTVYGATLKKNSVKLTSYKKRVKATWNKDSKASGYELYMKKAGATKYKLIKTFKSNKTVTYTKKDLTSGKKYYFRLRSYKKSDGKKIYGKYSTTKTIKVK